MLYDEDYCTSDIYTCMMLCHILGIIDDVNYEYFKDFNTHKNFDKEAFETVKENVEAIWEKIEEDFDDEDSD